MTRKSVYRSVGAIKKVVKGFIKFSTVCVLADYLFFLHFLGKTYDIPEDVDYQDQLIW